MSDPEYPTGYPVGRICGKSRILNISLSQIANIKPKIRPFIGYPAGIRSDTEYLAGLDIRSQGRIQAGEGELLPRFYGENAEKLAK